VRNSQEGGQREVESGDAATHLDGHVLLDAGDNDDRALQQHGVEVLQAYGL
jgi:hypothetical protein